MLHQQVKTIGANGQLSLGKEFTGKMVLIDQTDKATWIIKTGTFIPDNEKWLHESKHLRKLNKALDWAESNKPKDNFKQIVKDIEND